jgi:uncharacterized damage-inducible protein DinB
MADTWRTIVASALDCEQAHLSLDASLNGLPPKLRGRRPTRYPHSIWELVEHIRLAQTDLLAFMVDPHYRAPKWPDDYWPASPQPPGGAAWNASLKAIRRDTQRLKRLTTRSRFDLARKIPWADGQTYLRTILVAIDHTSYHVGQIVAVRRQLENWP